MRYALPCSKIRPWPIPQHLQIRCGISTKIRRTPVGEASAARHQGRSTSAPLKPRIHHGNMVPGGSRTHCAEMASQTTNSKNLSPTSLQNSVQNTFQYILVFLTETYLFYITKSNKMIFQKKSSTQHNVSNHTLLFSTKGPFLDDPHKKNNFRATLIFNYEQLKIWII